MREQELLERLAELFPASGTVKIGPGDDCAVIETGVAGKLGLAAADQVIQGIHYPPGEEPEAVAAKLLRRNVSDIAAMGGTPEYALVTVAVSPADPEFLLRFHASLKQEADRFGMSIAGGDLASLPNPGAVFTLSIYGTVPEQNLKLRSGARNGDLLLASGEFGNSFPTRHHLTFLPELELGRTLGTFPGVHAMMDVSDGLLMDALRMAKTSGRSLTLDCDSIPARAGASVEQRLTDGEDYGLLFAASEDTVPELRKLNRKITVIGRFGDGEPGTLTSPLRTSKIGFDHFL